MEALRSIRLRERPFRRMELDRLAIRLQQEHLEAPASARLALLKILLALLVWRRETPAPWAETRDRASLRLRIRARHPLPIRALPEAASPQIQVLRQEVRAPAQPPPSQLAVRLLDQLEAPRRRLRPPHHRKRARKAVRVEEPHLLHWLNAVLKVSPGDLVSRVLLFKLPERRRLMARPRQLSRTRLRRKGRMSYCN